MQLMEFSSPKLDMYLILHVLNGSYPLNNRHLSALHKIFYVVLADFLPLDLLNKSNLDMYLTNFYITVSSRTRLLLPTLEGIPLKK